MMKLRIVGRKFVECPRCQGNCKCRYMENGETKFRVCTYCEGKGEVYELIVHADVDTELSLECDGDC